MSSSAVRRTVPRLVAGVAVIGVAVLALATGSAQAPPKSAADDKAPTEAKVYRYAPTLAIVMVAYEGVINNNEQTNPEMVRALKRSFEVNPSARQTLAKIHQAYKALSPANREKVVGKELANATGNTRLTKELLQPILEKKFKRAPTLLAEKAPARVNPAMMKPIAVPDQEMLQDPKTKMEDKPVASRERARGLELKEGSSTRYRVEYTGLYCAREPADWGFHCEPYVIFVMRQGENSWTRGKGPYERCDSGDKFPDRLTLRSNTPFGYDLTVVGTTFEHDVGDIDSIEDALQSAVDTISGVVSIWWEVPDWLSDTVVDVLTWIADVFGLADDQIGEPQSIRFTKRFAEANTGHSTFEGIEYDRFLHCRGDMSGRLRQRGDFYAFLDVRPID